MSKKKPKKRASKYQEKVKIPSNLSFEDLIKKAVSPPKKGEKPK